MVRAVYDWIVVLVNDAHAAHDSGKMEDGTCAANSLSTKVDIAQVAYDALGIERQVVVFGVRCGVYNPDMVA